MKIMHLADLHLGKVLNGYSLIEDQKYILNQITEIIINEKIDTVLIAGDIYDKGIASLESIELFEEFSFKVVNTLGCYLLVTAGNHDTGNRLGVYRGLLNKKFIINLDFLNPKVEIDGVNFYLYPFKSLYELRHMYETEFVDTSEAYEYVFKNLELDKTKVNIAAFHDYFAKKPSELVTSDSERELVLGGSYYIYSDSLEAFDYVALGHLHNPQKVGTEKIRYSGSPLKYSFGESSSKSVPIYDTETKDIKLIELKPLRNMISIEGSLAEVTSADFYTKYKYKTDFFRIKLLDSTEIDMLSQRLKEVYPYLMEIDNSFDDKETSTKANKKYVNVTEALDDFYKEVCDYVLDTEDYKILNKLIGDLGYENK